MGRANTAYLRGGHPPPYPLSKRINARGREGVHPASILRVLFVLSNLGISCWLFLCGTLLAGQRYRTSRANTRYLRGGHPAELPPGRGPRCKQRGNLKEKLNQSK